MQFLGFHGMLYENKKRVGEMMKKISLWGIFLLFLFLFCGCTSEKASELWVVTEKGTWDRMNGQLYVLEEAWEKAHPGVDVRVEYLPTDEQERAVYLQQLRTEILRGGGPDCYLLPTDNTLILDEPQQYTYVDVEPLFVDVTLAMQNGLFYDLSDFFDADDDLGKDGLNQQIMDAGVVDGKRYVLPLRYDMPVIYAFNDALEEAGVDIDVLNKSIDSIMEAVGSTGDPILASGIFRDSLDVFSRVIDYESGNAALDENGLSRYMTAYQHLNADIGSALVVNPWTEKSEPFQKLYAEGIIAVEKLNVEHYLWEFFYGINFASETMWEYCPIWIGSMQDAFDYVPVSQYEDRELTVTPMRTMEGDVVATVTYYAAVGSGCSDPGLAYDFLRQFLLEESQWEHNRPKRNHTKPLKGLGNTANDLQYPGLIESGWPVRDNGDLDQLWYIRRKQFYNYRYIGASVEAERRMRRIGRMGVFEEEWMPLFDITIDEVRFNTTLSDDFADALARLNDSEYNPTQADIDTLTQQLIWNLRWHVSEG